MEKAILKTLIYADIFDYPLTIFEIHKWLIGPPAGQARRKATLRQVEKALNKLMVKGKVERVGGYCVLASRAGLVNKRGRRKKQSVIYLRKALVLVQILKIVPWIKLVGISGGLAMDNAEKRDDIDLFLVTAKNRLWISRILSLGLLTLTGQRRKVRELNRFIAGKLCLNTLLEEDRLEQKSKDMYLAHEVLQMKVLWQRYGIYSKYLSDNEWAFKFLPNWTTSVTQNSNVKTQNYSSKLKTFDLVELLARWLQLKLMKKPQGKERIEEGALYFHPKDYRLQILETYKQKVKKIISP